MNIVILTANFGNGHKAVANTIKEQLGDRANIIIADPRVYESDLHLDDKAYDFIYNKVITRYTDNPIVSNYYHAAYKLGSLIPFCVEINKRQASKRIANLIQKEEPDIIITTYPHYIKYPKNYPKNIDIYTIITDYTFENFWYDKQIKGYFVASVEVKNRLLKKGVNPDDIYITGIPINNDFFMDNTRTKCEKILLTLGARGQISKKDITSLVDKLNSYDIKTFIVCGSNVQLKEYLDEYCDPNNFEIYQFVNNMPELFKEIDLVITKAGGISVSEAIAAERPMIINKTQSLKGQELANIEFITKHNLGIVLENKDIVDGIIEFVENQEKYIETVNNLKNIKNKLYIEDICDIVLENE